MRRKLAVRGMSKEHIKSGDDTHGRIEQLQPLGEGIGTSQRRVRHGKPKRIRRDEGSRGRPSFDGTKCVSEWTRRELHLRRDFG